MSIVNCLISSKPWKLVACIYTNYCVYWKLSLMCTNTFFINFFLQYRNFSKYDVSTEYPKKLLEMCKHLRESMESFLSLCFQKHLEEMIVVCWLLYIFLSSEGFRNTMKLILYKTAVNRVISRKILVTPSTFVSPFYERVFNWPVIVARLN